MIKYKSLLRPEKIRPDQISDEVTSMAIISEEQQLEKKLAIKDDEYQKLWQEETELQHKFVDWQK